MVAGSGNVGVAPAKAGAAEATRTNADAIMRFILPTFRVILSQMKQLLRRKGKACKNRRLMILAFSTVTHVYDNAGARSACVGGPARNVIRQTSCPRSPGRCSAAWRRWSAKLEGARICGRGGTGRRTRFRSERFTAWGFKSLRPHHCFPLGSGRKECEIPPPSPVLAGPAHTVFAP